MPVFALTMLLSKVRSMDKRAIAILIMIIVIYLFAMAFLLLRERTKRMLWKSTHGYMGQEKTLDSLFYTVYRTLKAFPFTRTYLEKLSYQFRLICPCDSKTIAKMTVEACLLSLCLNIVVLFLIFLTNPQLITLITAIFGIIILNKEIVGRMANHYEIKLDLEIQQLIENEIHHYYVNYRVDDALYHSMDHLSSNMKLVADQIYQLLLSDDKEAALTQYYDNIPNKFLREFVSLCVGVAERGDQMINGKFLFVKNLENLYEQLEIEIDKLQRLKLEFTGVMIVVILPIFCIPIVKWFCISIKSNMDAFYYGKEGFLSDILLLVITSIIYTVMQKSAEYRSFHISNYKYLYALDRIPFIKKAMNNYCEKYATKVERLKRLLKNNGYHIRARHYVLRNYLIAACMFLICICISVYLNWAGRERLLTVDEEYISTITSAADERQYTKMKEMIETYTLKLVSQKQRTNAVTEEELLKQLNNERTFSNTLINKALAEEIMHRFKRYQTLHFGVWDMLFSLIVSIASFYAPYLLVKFSSRVSKDAMEDEVNQFNALISMLIYDKGMTIKQVLIDMESYAVVFKQSIRTCMNEYNSGDMMALHQLKEDEPYPPLIRIIDNLIRCDDMPMYEAFHEVDMEREGYLSKRKLANEKSIRRRVNRAYLLAAVPLILLFVYGIIPTLVSSMNEIRQTLEILDMLS